MTRQQVDEVEHLSSGAAGLSSSNSAAEAHGKSGWAGSRSEFHPDAGHRQSDSAASSEEPAGTTGQTSHTPGCAS